MISTFGKVITSSLLLVATALASVGADEQVRLPRSFLIFDEIIDGRCQNLSAGGKLQVLLNTHPSRNIKFRLIRYFVDVRQNGRATGIAEISDTPVKLGCTIVGGRVQRWEVERAEFTPDQ